MRLYVYSIVKTENGDLKTVKEIEEIHANSVRFTDKTTQMKSMLREVDGWIPIEQGEPQREVIALGYQSEMLIGYISGTVCESDGQCLYDVTHWRPKPFTHKQIMEVFN